VSVAALCQRAGASCGACCGLYNRRDHGEPSVRALLSRRTRALAGVARTPPAFAAAARRISAAEEAPLLGWLDAAETRVGCLAHPSATGGPDLRDCGAYDASICDGFLCPSHAWLGEAEAEIAIRACGDWYLYGLVVTDVPFLRACLGAIARGAGAQVEPRHLEDGRFRAALRRLLALKRELAPGSDGLYGAFEPGPDPADAEPRPRAIDYAALGRDRSPWDEILLCAGADPRSGNDLDALEAQVRARLDGAVAALPS
jgi:hypothetical protein